MSLTKKQLALRKGKIGSSLVPVIMGLSKWMTPFEAYLELIGETPPKKENRAMQKGSALEPVVAGWVEEDMGPARLEPCPSLVHPCGWAIATPDRLIVEPDGSCSGVVEIKCRNPRAAKEYGQEGTDEIQPTDLVQVVWQHIILASIGIHGEGALKNWMPRTSFLAANFGDDDYSLFPVQIDDAFKKLEAVVWQRAEKFWQDHVEPRRPPPVDGSDACRAYIERQYTKTSGKLRIATQEEAELARHIRGLSAEIEAKKDALDKARNELRLKIADADGLEGDGIKATYKWQKGSTYTVTREPGRVLRITEKKAKEA